MGGPEVSDAELSVPASCEHENRPAGTSIPNFESQISFYGAPPFFIPPSSFILHSFILNFLE
jgi:hypothetical protein